MSTNNRPKHVFVSYIRTTPEQLWNAITKSEFTRRYFHATSIESDWKVGSPMRYTMGEAREVASEGKILESDRPKRLSMTWLFKYDPELAKEKPSRVTWEIEPNGEVCKLTVIHDDFDGETRTYKAVGAGWPAILSSLKTLLETGEPLPVARD
jgi:uncharacterized protein YndB with AHSA1/START domain